MAEIFWAVNDPAGRIALATFRASYLNQQISTGDSTESTPNLLIRSRGQYPATTYNLSMDDPDP
jgi:hypothetical protein